MNKTIRKFKMFLITDYEKEENYLSDMSKKGYRLKKVSFPGFYTFEEVNPEDFVYRLSFKSSNESDFNNYITLLEDNGWEYLLEYMGWSYFRKSGNESNTEIFSDDESRIEEVNRVITSRYLPLFIIFTLSVLPNAIEAFKSGFSKDNLGTNFAYIFILLVFVLYIFLIAYCGLGLYKLRKKYSIK